MCSLEWMYCACFVFALVGGERAKKPQAGQGVCWYHGLANISESSCRICFWKQFTPCKENLAHTCFHCAGLDKLQTEMGKDLKLELIKFCQYTTKHFRSSWQQIWGALLFIIPVTITLSPPCYSHNHLEKFILYLLEEIDTKSNTGRSNRLINPTWCNNGNF